MNVKVNSLFLVLALVMAGCSSAPEKANQSAGDTLPPRAYELALPEELRSRLGRTFSGDLDGMVKRRIIRAGVPFNRTFYFVDKGVQRGLSYDYLMLFEEQLNKSLNTGNPRCMSSCCRCRGMRCFRRSRRARSISSPPSSPSPPSDRDSWTSRIPREATWTKYSSPARDPRRSRRLTTWPARRSSFARVPAIMRACRRIIAS